MDKNSSGFLLVNYNAISKTNLKNGTLLNGIKDITNKKAECLENRNKNQ